MATALISKFSRQLIVSAAARRNGSSVHLGKGRFGFALATEFDYAQLREVSSDTNISLLGNNINILLQQKGSFGRG